MPLFETKKRREFALQHAVEVSTAEEIVELARTCSATKDLHGWTEKGKLLAWFRLDSAKALVVYNERRTRGADGKLRRKQKRVLTFRELSNSILYLAWMTTLRWCPPGTQGWSGQPLELLALEMFREA